MRLNSAAGSLPQHSRSSNNISKGFAMYTRIAEFVLKPDKLDDFRHIIAREVYPVLRGQPGFVDVVAAIADDNPYRVLSITFWQNKDDADRYGAEQYGTVIDSLAACLERTPQVGSYTVDQSTHCTIAAGKAA
jgi:quinol monooxygenase YgiN